MSELDRHFFARTKIKNFKIFLGAELGQFDATGV